jgi:hypothetical protein
MRMRMRKRFLMVLAALFALSVIAAGCGKESLPPQPQPPKKETAVTEKKAAPKPRVKLFTGTIMALDVAEGTLTLKGPRGTMGFHADEQGKKQLDGLKIGDKVIVKHIDEIALSVVKPRTSSSALVREEKKAL